MYSLIWEVVSVTSNYWGNMHGNLMVVEAQWPIMLSTLYYGLSRQHLELTLMFNSYSAIWFRCRSGGVASCSFRKCKGVLWYRKSRNTCKICWGKYFSFLFFFSISSLESSALFCQYHKPWLWPSHWKWPEVTSSLTFLSDLVAVFVCGDKCRLK